MATKIQIIQSALKGMTPGGREARQVIFKASGIMGGFGVPTGLPDAPFRPTRAPFSPRGPTIGGFDLSAVPGVIADIIRRKFGAFPRSGQIPSPPVLPGPGRLPQAMPQFDCPKGFHQAKDGSGRCVRNRRMNALNPRALRRCLRRVEGFQRFVKRSGLTVSPRRGRKKPRIQIVHKGAITEA